MNLLLLHPQDLTDSNTAVIDDYRAQHLLNIHKASVGSSVRVGLLNGLMGIGEITAINHQQVQLTFHCDQSSPPATDLTLILALPRPQMLKRSLQTVASLGVKHIYLIASTRVEKSFWSSPQLTPEAIRQNLVLGLEQAVDTQMPQVYFKQRFKPFVEDELPSLCTGKKAYLAHPGDYPPCPNHDGQPTLLAIGPEGGFLDYEVAMMEEAGCQTFQFGPRILRVETAVPMLISRFYKA